MGLIFLFRIFLITFLIVETEINQLKQKLMLLRILNTRKLHFEIFWREKHEFQHMLEVRLRRL